jgi:hypothetical protein
MGDTHVVDRLAEDFQEQCLGRRCPGQPARLRSARPRLPSDRQRDRGHRSLRSLQCAHPGRSC